MKKIISRAILSAFSISVIYYLFRKVIIAPCMELYQQYGTSGIGIFLLAIAILICVAYRVLKLIFWCIDNM